jgi:hypothetical protein
MHIKLILAIMEYPAVTQAAVAIARKEIVSQKTAPHIHTIAPSVH